jgi:hypothetical protein
MPAQDEIIKRIKQLDTEETKIRTQASERLREAEKMVAQAKGMIADAEVCACVRRQYEFALTQLGAEMPTAIKVDIQASAPQPVPVRCSQ